MLTRYEDVFSKGELDVGQTNLVQHEIPLEPVTRPIRQPARRLGVEKEAEVERQLEDLQNRSPVEAVSGSWSSPLVLV